MKINKSFLKIFLSLSIIFILFAPGLVRASLPTPTVKGEVRGTNEEDAIAVVNWETSDVGEYGFKVEKEGPGGRQVAAIYNPISTGIDNDSSGGFYVDIAVLYGETYTYWVSSFDRAGEESEAGKTALKIVLQNSCEKDFSTFDASQEGNIVTLSWNSICGALEYRLTRDGADLQRTNELSYQDKDVPQGDREYTVEAYDEKTSTAFIKSIFFTPVLAQKPPIATKTIKVTVIPSPAGSPINLPGKYTNIMDLLVDIINFLLAGIGASAVIAIIYSGIMIITAGGDPEKAAKGRRNLTWAIIGVIIAALCIVIVNYVINIFS